MQVLRVYASSREFWAFHEKLVTSGHNPDEPEPKRLSLTEWSSHGIFFREPFHFREPNFFAFFCTNLTL
jgi:hypothetical protein